MKLLKLGSKILAGLIVFILIVAVLGYFALTHWINPNDFKPQITELVQKETGRHLTLSGNLAWTFFPNIGIEINNAALSNPPGFTQPTFASVDSVDLAVSLSALLHGEVKVNRLVVNGLQVFLISDNGRNNWTFTNSESKAARKSHGQKKSIQSAAAADSKGKSAFDVMLHQVSVNNASLTYDDLKTKTHMVLSNFDLNLPEFNLDKPMSLKASGDINTDSLASHFALDTLFMYDLTKNTVALTDTALNTRTAYTNDQNKTLIAVIDTTGSARINLDNETVNVPALNFALNQTLKGKVKLNLHSFDKVYYAGSVVIPPFSLVSLMNALGQSFPDIPNKAQFNHSSLQAQFKGDLNRVALNKIKVSFGQTQIQGNVNIAKFDPLALSEKLAANQVDVADFTNLNGAHLLLSKISLAGSTKTSGFAPGQFPQGLTANQNVQVGDVLLKGFDLRTMLQQIDKMVNNLLDVKQVSNSYSALQSHMGQLKGSTGSVNAENGKQTDFGTLKANIVAKNGTVTTPVLFLQGPVVHVNGKGSANLMKQSLNYHFNAKVVSSNHNLIQNLDIPVQVAGKFSNVSANVDWASIQSQIMKFLVGQVGKNIFNSLGGREGGQQDASAGSTSTSSANKNPVKGIANALGGLFGK